MNHFHAEQAFEELAERLADPKELHTYKKIHNDYQPSLLPRIFGSFLVHGGNFVYGANPSYLKFRALEVIARVPYHSWQAVGFVLLTLFYTNEQKALDLAKTADFARIAQDNETMHVVVISALAKQEEHCGFIRGTVLPVCFAFFYFFSSTFLYLIRSRWSFELNYIFEQHAFEQYQRLLETRGEELKKKKINSTFLSWYGRKPKNQYEFFVSVRNDEIIHRNHSIESIS